MKSDLQKHCARGGTLTTSQAFKTQDSRATYRILASPRGHTRKSETKSVDIVHTSFVAFGRVEELSKGTIAGDTGRTSGFVRLFRTCNSLGVKEPWIGRMFSSAAHRFPRHARGGRRACALVVVFVQQCRDVHG